MNIQGKIGEMSSKFSFNRVFLRMASNVQCKSNVGLVN